MSFFYHDAITGMVELSLQIMKSFQITKIATHTHCENLFLSTKHVKCTFSSIQIKCVCTSCLISTMTLISSNTFLHECENKRNYLFS